MLGTFCRIWNFSYQDKKPNQVKQHLAKTEKPTLHKLWVFKPQSKPWQVAKDGRQRDSKSRLHLPGGGGGSPCSPLSPDGSPAPPASQAQPADPGLRACSRVGNRLDKGRCCHLRNQVCVFVSVCLRQQAGGLDWVLGILGSPALSKSHGSMWGLKVDLQQAVHHPNVTLVQGVISGAGNGFSVSPQIFPKC